jgi:hypothetical protein
MGGKKSLLRAADGARSKAGAKPPLYDRRRANRISLRIVIVVALVLAAYVGIQVYTDPAKAGPDSLEVRALFGFRVPYSEITELRLESEPVATGARVFGNSAFGLFLEGDFMVDGLGKARVFLKRPNVSYILVRTADRDYAISLGSADKDRALYERMRLGMPSRAGAQR